MATYDVIVVGARCSGSATAMLLARAGMRVLVIDRASFSSDTISGHMIKPAGVARLQRWGLLEQLLATGCRRSVTACAVRRELNGHASTVR
jgi:flavin-dependent dehydrogenase